MLRAELFMEDTAADVLQPPRRPGLAERWSRFETDFEVRETAATPFRYRLAIAKYQIDTALFAVNCLVNDLNAALDWTYSNGAWHGIGERRDRTVVSTARNGAGLFAGARVKADLSLLSGRPRLGLKVVIPFGR